MPDFLADAMEWLTETHKAHVSRVVEYRRGNTVAEVRATIGLSSQAASKTVGNTKTERSDRDYIFAVADLVAAGFLMPPAREDRIADVEDGATAIYEVRPAGGDPCYRWCDGDRAAVRVHTKKIGTE